MAEGEEGNAWGSCEVVGAISEGTRRTSGPRSRNGDPVGNQMPRLLHCYAPIPLLSSQTNFLYEKHDILFSFLCLIGRRKVF